MSAWKRCDCVEAWCLFRHQGLIILLGRHDGRTMPRLFIAVPVARSVRASLAEVSQPVETPKLSWVEPGAMHLTLAFLGEVEETDVLSIERGMREAVRTAPMTLALCAAGLGAFPNERRARVLWAGVTGDVVALAALEKALTARLGDEGILREDRRFQPHITLARLREPGPLPVGLPIQGVFGEWRATELQLIESRLGNPQHPGSPRARYEVRASRRLGES